MNRGKMIQQIKDANEIWDFIIIGGGATGAGIAVEAASRGYKTLLLEQYDFGKGTSSRSTKLVHGGVRYLQQGNISLVLEALKERGLLLQNAPHLVSNLSFIVPSYDWWEGPFYGIGLKLYDLMAGKAGFGKSKLLSREKTIELLPNIEKDGLNGGVIYHDGQFDDARLVINLVQTAAEQGAAAVNYMPVLSLLRQDGLISGVVAQDSENQEEYKIEARVVINATGPFADAVCRMDDKDAPKMIQPSQGVHIVLERKFLAGSSAIMVPHTDDGRVIFAIPWNNRVVVGTTDTPLKEAPIEPLAQEEEIAFLLRHISRYLAHDPQKQDILSVFTGIRPLVGAEKEGDTSVISREHTIRISRSGLVTIAGGKWTTYRKMAEDTVDQALEIGGLEERPSVSRKLNIHGFLHYNTDLGSLARYGSDAVHIQNMMSGDKHLAKKLYDDPPVYAAEVIYAVKEEMTRTVEDFLSRRCRLLFLDAKASVEIAPQVAKLMARELGKSRKWQKEQVRAFSDLAKNYML